MNVQESVIEPETGHKEESILQKVSKLDGMQAQPEPEGAEDKPKAPSPAEDPDLAGKFAALAKQEKRVRDLQREMEAERQELERYRSQKQKAKEDPESWLSEAGLTLDEAIDLKLRGMSTPTETDRVLSVEEKLKNMQAELDRRDAEAKQQRQSEAVQRFKAGIQDVIDSNPEDFELIKSFGAIDSVYETCEKYYEESGGQTLEVEKACRLVEAGLEKEVQKYKGVKKLKSLFEQHLESSSEEEKQEPQATDTRPASTLTTRVVSPAQADTPKRLLSREESLAKISKWLEEKTLERERASAAKAGV